MLNLLFNPNGRISSSQMIVGGITLIVIGFIPSLIMMLAGASSTVQILGWLTYLLGIPWVFLWMKRYRDGGKPPVMCLVPIAVYLVLFLIIAGVLLGGDFITMFTAGMEAGAEDPEAMEAAMEDAMDVQSFARKGMIAGALASLLTLFGINATIKHKPENTETFS